MTEHRLTEHSLPTVYFQFCMHHCHNKIVPNIVEDFKLEFPGQYRLINDVHKFMYK